MMFGDNGGFGMASKRQQLTPDPEMMNQKPPVQFSTRVGWGGGNPMREIQERRRQARMMSRDNPGLPFIQEPLPSVVQQGGPPDPGPGPEQDQDQTNRMGMAPRGSYAELTRGMGYGDMYGGGYGRGRGYGRGGRGMGYGGQMMRPPYRRGESQGSGMGGGLTRDLGGGFGGGRGIADQQMQGPGDDFSAPRRMFGGGGGGGSMSFQPQPPNELRGLQPGPDRQSYLDDMMY